MNQEQMNQELLKASENGQLEIVKFFLENGVDIDTENYNGNTPLLKASEKGHLKVVKYLIENAKRSFNKNQFIYFINVNNSDGDTPLHMACCYGYLEVVKFLVDNGADVNAKSICNDTPLHMACWCGNLEVVKFLVENGKQSFDKNQFIDFIESRNDDGDTPFDYAYTDEIIEYLKEQMKTIDKRCSENVNKTPNPIILEYMEKFCKEYKYKLIKE